MKVLFILDEFLPENSGGAANVAFALAKGLMVAGNELLVVTATHDPEKVGKLKIDNVQIEIIFSKPFSYFFTSSTTSLYPACQDLSEYQGL